MRACNFFGGPERQIVGHINNSRNFAHMVLTFIENGKSNEFLDKCHYEGIACVTIKTKSSYEPSSIFKLREILKSSRPAVLCSHGYKTSVLSLAAKWGLHIPLIVFSRGHTGENLKVRFFEALERMTLRLADGIVAVSKGYVDFLIEKGLPENRIRVVPNAIDLKRIKPHLSKSIQKRFELGFGEKDILIATAGRLSPEKAQKDLISAFGSLYTKFDKLHLLIIGEGPLRKSLEHQVKMSCIPNVHFLGYRTDLDDIMAAIDLFVLSSTTEGMPNVVLEAFAAKKAVVSTGVGGVPEIIENGVNGVLVDANSAESIADAIWGCLADPKATIKMGQLGYEKIKKDFTFEAQAEKLESIYQERL